MTDGKIESLRFRFAQQDGGHTSRGNILGLGRFALWLAAFLPINLLQSAESSPGKTSAPLFSWEKSLVFSGKVSDGPPQPINAFNLAVHDGKLFTGTGTDFEQQQFSGRSSYVFVKNSAREDWKLDADFGPQTSRVGLLFSARFVNDAEGKLIAGGAKEILLAGTIKTPKSDGTQPFQIHVRDDQTGRWSNVIIGKTPLQEYNLRTAIVHRDTVTGADLVFLGASPFPLGPISGVYDPTAEGRIRWSANSEPVQDQVSKASKWFGMANVNGALFGSTAMAIYRRIDGENPRWILVAEYPAVGDSANREVRGLTAVPNISTDTGWPEKEVLFFTNQMQICRLRVPADATAAHPMQVELDLRDALAKGLGERVLFAEAAFNQLAKFTIPGSGKTLWPVGVQWVRGSGELRAYRKNVRQAGGGPPAGDLPHPAYYFLRDEAGKYTLESIKSTADRILFLARDFAVSPFEGENGVLYACGFNGSFIRQQLGTAWVYRGTWR